MGRRTERIRTRLQRACEERVLVEIRLVSGSLRTGFVVQLGTEWVMVAEILEQGVLDGWCCYPVDRVRSVTFEPDPEAACVRMLRAHGSWPLPAAPVVALSGARELVAALAGQFQVLALRVKDRPLVGRVTDIRTKSVVLTLIDGSGVWDPEPERVRWADIVEITAGSPYAALCLQVATHEGAVDRLRKPPKQQLDADVIASLEQARVSQQLVRIRRRIRKAEVLEGYVTGVGREWVALATLDPLTLAFGGWDMVRRSDIVKVTTPRRGWTQLWTRVSDLQGLRPFASPGVSLDSLVEALHDARDPVIGVFREHYQVDAGWFGTVVFVDDRVLQLREISLLGDWANRARWLDLADITRLTLGDPYQNAMGMVADPM